MVLTIKPYFADRRGLWSQLPLPGLSPSPAQVHSVHIHVFQEFASEGLRTLMVAYRELDKSFFHAWYRKHSEVSLSLEDRESKISSVYEEIEKDLTVSGKKPGTDTGTMGDGGQPTEQGL